MQCLFWIRLKKIFLTTGGNQSTWSWLGWSGEHRWRQLSGSSGYFMSTGWWQLAVIKTADRPHSWWWKLWNIYFQSTHCRSIKPTPFMIRINTVNTRIKEPVIFCFRLLCFKRFLKLFLEMLHSMYYKFALISEWLTLTGLIMTLNTNNQTAVYWSNPSVGEIWIFSETTHCAFVMVQHTYLDLPECCLILSNFSYKNLLHLSGWIVSYILIRCFFYAGV